MLSLIKIRSKLAGRDSYSAVPESVRRLSAEGSVVGYTFVSPTGEGGRENNEEDEEGECSFC